MSKSADISFLKEKTDAECRQLAGQYYRRARKAEKEHEATLRRLAELEEKVRIVTHYASLISEVTDHD